MREENQIIHVFDTYLALPSGRTISLDAVKTFAPNREFWALWRARKIEIKRAGIGVRLEKETGEWRGYVRGKYQGFSYTQSDLHAYWTELAKVKANGEQCGPVIVPSAELSSSIKRPCDCLLTYQVVAKVCKNGTFQIRLKCVTCLSKTPGAIAWNDLGSELVIASIAHALKNPTSLSDIRSGAYSFV